MLEGYGHPRVFGNIVDVRDAARAQRPIAECSTNRNGERYNLVATHESGLIPQQEVQAILRRLHRDIGIGGNYREEPVRPPARSTTGPGGSSTRAPRC